MKITFNEQTGAGLKTFRSWDRLGLEKALNQSVKLHPGERIAQVNIEPDGVTVVIEQGKG